MTSSAIIQARIEPPISSPRHTLSQKKHHIEDIAAKVAILLCIAIIIGVGMTQENDVHLFTTNTWTKALFIFFKILLVIFILATLWRTVLFLRYRPVSPYPDECLPTCGVIVPAYNEGPQVLETLKSIAKSDYPKERLKIVVVDDGSIDDTWAWIQQAVNELPGRIIPVRLPQNQGKRRALYSGFLRCPTEIFVTIDSDSQVEPRTLRSIVSPFIRDPKVGAVAGNVRILNRREGLIPRMLDVAFAFAFDFLRASQSVVNTVMCSPGALSAYRSDLVKNALPQWISQTFLGRQANIGEDRAMTNMILKQGFHVHFQSTAKVYTKVPTRYRQLCRMFLRWARSNIRETLVMTRFVFTRFRGGPMLGARVNLLLGLLNLTACQMAKPALLMVLLSTPGMLNIRCLLWLVSAGALPAIFFIYRYRSSNALWAFVYTIFWSSGLWWISLYATITPHKTGWLTRDLALDTDRVLSMSKRAAESAPAMLKKAA